MNKQSEAHSFTHAEVLEKSMSYFQNDELAATTWINKYAIKNRQGEFLEQSPDDMHQRMAKEFSRIEDKYHFDINTLDKHRYNGLSEFGKKHMMGLTETDIFDLFKDFKYVIPQGSVMSSLGNDQVIASLSNCVVVPPVFDSYGGIFYTDQQLAQLFKRRCGVGVDLSHLRPNGANVSNSAGSTTGAVSFMHRFSNTTREVAQNGRRGALMLTMDVAHPDIEEFINVKQDLLKVTGANISIRLSDEFMTAVVNDTDYLLRWPIDSKSPTYTKTIKAKELWHTIISCAHKTAEPGLIFWDRQHNYSTSSVYPGFKNDSTNPCFTGDTMVAVADGRNAVSIQQLAEENVPFTVYSARKSKSNGSQRKSWKTEIKPAIAFKSGTKEVLTVMLSDGSQFECTPDHRLALSTGGYIEAAYSMGCMIASFIATNTTIMSSMPSKVIDIIKTNKIVDVYDLTVEDNHNFYIITKTDDDTYLNCSGVLVHNCAEIAMQGGDSCRLIAMNLYSFVSEPFTENAAFDFVKFYEVTYNSQRLMDDLVDLELESVDRILAKIEKDSEPGNVKQLEIDTWKLLKKTGKAGRRTGLGFTALADTLAALGIKFDTSEAVAVVDVIMQVKLRAEFDSSVDMAITRGKFDAFDPDVENTSEFVQMMQRDFPELYARMMTYGRRNISISTIAPTGSLSMLAQTSSGIEPVYMLAYKRRRKVNTEDDNAIVSYIDDTGDAFEEFDVYHQKVKTWMNITGKTDVKESAYRGATATEIDWKKRVELQALVQKYTTHSISSTINLASTVSIDLVGEIYIESWKQGLKGITVYRDGSRSGILVDVNDKGENSQNDDIYAETVCPKRPRKIVGKVVRFQNAYDKWVAVVGLINEKPYEIFTGKIDDGFNALPVWLEEGLIVKTKDSTGRSQYNLEYVDAQGHKVVFEKLSHAFDKEYWNYAKLISGVLRHGMPIQYVVELIKNLNMNDENINTWKNGVSRALKLCVPNGTIAVDRTCPECGDPEGLIYEEGCLKCKNCGHAKCG